MREIKFRAWCKLDNTYVEPYTVQEMIFQKDSDIPLDVLYNEFEFEQYTGIKDKNGVDIYEGDIVEPVEEDVDFEDEYYQIVYNETGDYPAFDLKGWAGEINGISELLLTYGIKVVGNIHKNADLLEEQ